MKTFDSRFKQSYEDLLAGKLNEIEWNLAAIGHTVKTGAGQVEDKLLSDLQAKKEAVKESFQQLKASQVENYEEAKAKFNREVHELESSIEHFHKRLDEKIGVQKEVWEKRMAAVGTHVDHMIARVGQYEEDVKQTIHQDVETAREKLAAARAAWNRFVDADEKAVGDVWKGFVAAWDDLRQSLHNAYNRF